LHFWVSFSQKVAR
jgi:hypothetical protein